MQVQELWNDGVLCGCGLSGHQRLLLSRLVEWSLRSESLINRSLIPGSDQPEAAGIEQLIHHLDSSGGLLPRAMRGDMLRPAWQFHGAENPLADRDQSCYVCCSLGESAFLGTFSCATYLLQNIEVSRSLSSHS